jgi:broad specificity phosphatase PhoE
VSKTNQYNLVLVRHGETEWSKSGKHTGISDIPLTGKGRAEAKEVGGLLKKFNFGLVLVSPAQRAQDTCKLAELGDSAIITEDLSEWNYGAYDGQTTPEIQQKRPGWSLWRDGVVDGESVTQVGDRADRVIATALSVSGDVALFAHGHILRILTARWLGLPAKDGALFALDPATLSVLGWEHDTHVISRWNLAP